MTEGSTDRYPISIKIIRETEKAWFIDTGDAKIWFPKSQGEVYRNKDGTHDLFGEEWIMKEKGLI